MENMLLLSREIARYHLSPEGQDFLKRTLPTHRLSFSQMKKVVGLANDLEIWGTSIEAIWPSPSDKMSRDDLFQALLTQESLLKKTMIELDGFTGELRKGAQERPAKEEVVLQDDGRPIIGRCPVYSDKTRCCSLQTLDAVMGCSMGCSYCSIGAFYAQKKNTFHADLAQKLKAIKIDPKKRYHIGTGQSSDSLLWGDRHRVLSALYNWAGANPNIALEMKTKTTSISFFKDRPLQPNMLLSWSLSAPSVWRAEEHATASPAQRIDAARQAADLGYLVGFHFHPMFYFKGWEEEYQALAQTIEKLFSPDELFTISMGTLTYSKASLKHLRESLNRQSKVLQIDFEEIAGKFSYPLEIKEKLFSHLASSLPAGFLSQVFHYLCMEAPELWEPCFGFSYKDNTEFEQAMLDSYFNKIEKKRAKM